eukprot:g6474.t1
MLKVNHPLKDSFLRTFLLSFSYAFAILWNFIFGMRAEIREVDYISPVDLKWKHQHYSLWHHVDCSDWNDNYEGSQQPVRCTIYWFSRPGMILGIIGYLAGIGAGCFWFCSGSCFKLNINNVQQRTGIILFFAGFLLFVGWIAVLLDDSLSKELDFLSSKEYNKTALPNGSPGQETIHHDRWWFGMLSGPLFWVFGGLIWFYKGKHEAETKTPSAVAEEYHENNIELK